MLYPIPPKHNAGRSDITLIYGYDPLPYLKAVLKLLKLVDPLVHNHPALGRLWQGLSQQRFAKQLLEQSAAPEWWGKYPDAWSPWDKVWAEKPGEGQSGDRYGGPETTLPDGRKLVTGDQMPRPPFAPDIRDVIIPTETAINGFGEWGGLVPFSKVKNADDPSSTPLALLDTVLNAGPDLFELWPEESWDLLERRGPSELLQLHEMAKAANKAPVPLTGEYYEGQLTKMLLQMAWPRIMESKYLHEVPEPANSVNKQSSVRTKRALRVATLDLVLKMSGQVARLRQWSRLAKIREIESMFDASIIVGAKEMLDTLHTVAAYPIHPLHAELDAPGLAGTAATPWSESNPVVGVTSGVFSWLLKARVDQATRMKVIAANDGDSPDIYRTPDNVIWRRQGMGLIAQRIKVACACAKRTKRLYEWLMTHPDLAAGTAQRCFGFVSEGHRPKFGLYGPDTQPVFTDGYYTSEPINSLWEMLLRPILPVRKKGFVPWIADELIVSLGLERLSSNMVDKAGQSLAAHKEKRDLSNWVASNRVLFHLDPDDIEPTEEFIYGRMSPKYLRPIEEWQGEVHTEMAWDVSAVAAHFNVSEAELRTAVIEDVVTQQYPEGKAGWRRLFTVEGGEIKPNLPANSAKVLYMPTKVQVAPWTKTEQILDPTATVLHPNIIGVTEEGGLLPPEVRTARFMTDMQQPPAEYPVGDVLTGIAYWFTGSKKSRP